MDRKKTLPLAILYSCKHFVVVNKPYAVNSQPQAPKQLARNAGSRKGQQHNRLSGNSAAPGVTITELFRSQYPDYYSPTPRNPSIFPTPVHRLDYEVTGAMILATSVHAAKYFPKNFKLGGANGWPIKKTYLALVDPHEDRSVLLRPERAKDLYSLRLDSESPMSGIISTVQHTSTGALTSATSFRVLGRLPSGEMLLQLEPITGRKHQIRVHCAKVLQAPVVGDRSYGYVGARGYRSRQMALHSWRLDLKPGNDWVSVVAPVPAAATVGNGVWVGIADPATGLLLPEWRKTIGPSSAS
ncbi:pseudouridine synthase [Lipomyces oligophaga]|uniref:pseudouridine synthase n=1 Tax=Lipomyces oligophaga TaxID=45792 RepID=UPI0034CD75B6